MELVRNQETQINYITLWGTKKRSNNFNKVSTEAISFMARNGAYDKLKISRKTKTGERYIKQKQGYNDIIQENTKNIMLVTIDKQSIKNTRYELNRK